MYCSPRTMFLTERRVMLNVTSISVSFREHHVLFILGYDNDIVIRYAVVAQPSDLQKICFCVIVYGVLKCSCFETFHLT